MEDDNTNDAKTKYKKKLSPVPCGKIDVFASSLLSPMDKRRLMKFLQRRWTLPRLKRSRRRTAQVATTRQMLGRRPPPQLLLPWRVGTSCI
jgi:RAB protein geranylgeranyltransferase component A